ncbi:VIT1/CCC1 transporter family protein [Cyanobium sp. Morenito 9A2]|uniref:VIT1/CCC1 transporter family protein n=1 Tax=Cyanobium sp. Morenito 9A2 TaxID=2823718 RepID=UPI0020CDA481|nr:VIT1/CCC1 transporter family protein [Cyanobium sp. Morenito 9A2]MCP9850376.1 VIT1/CCC1 transporter family protein [Cyanobium sp. Morenito 9A2]
MPKPSLLHSLRTSFDASIGDVFFGMEDGTVSIFGLVAGVALTASSGKSVLIAGASGTVAAAVSMLAGVFLDLPSEQDKERVNTRRRLAAVRADPTGEIAALMGCLGRTGLQPATLAAIESDLPEGRRRCRTWSAGRRCPLNPVASSPGPMRSGCSCRICSRG